MANELIPIRFLRSLIPVVRPIAANLLEGQPALNSESSEPGLYLKGTAGDLIKIGPVAVGEEPPNASVNGGTDTNSKGELWLDKSNPDGPLLKVYDGDSWEACFPVAYARALVQEATPDPANFLEGTIWWNSATGLQYILYGTGSEGQWIQLGSSPVN